MGRPQVGRRELLLGAGAVLASAAVPARADPDLMLTPGQTEGPFYPDNFPSDVDNDLTRVRGRPGAATGQTLLISGGVLDRRGRAVRNTLVEIWHVDARGRYLHPGGGGDAIDPFFQGYGRAPVDARGRYTFRTIRPAAYPGRTPHIHYAVRLPGRGRFITQLYFAGEPRNATDGVLRSIRDPRAQRSVVRPFVITGGSLAGSFDIVLDV